MRWKRGEEQEEEEGKMEGRKVQREVVVVVVG